MIESQRGALNKFVISNKQNTENNLGEQLINEQEIHQKELKDNKNTIDISTSIVANIIRKKHIIRRKKQFDENANGETTQFAEESFRIDYFLYIIDQAISSIQSRFEQFQIYKTYFGFLFNFKKLKSLDYDGLKINVLI